VESRDAEALTAKRHEYVASKRTFFYRATHVESAVVCYDPVCTAFRYSAVRQCCVGTAERTEVIFGTGATLAGRGRHRVALCTVLWGHLCIFKVRVLPSVTLSQL